MTSTLEDVFTQEHLDEIIPCELEGCDKEVTHIYHHMTSCRIFICQEHAEEGIEQLRHVTNCPAHRKGHVDCQLCNEKYIPVENVRFIPI